MVREDWAIASVPATASSSMVKMRANLEFNVRPDRDAEAVSRPRRLRDRECPEFTVARPCGEQMDEYGAWFDLTGKISTPSLHKNRYRI
jgi:hypothetical protein